MLEQKEKTELDEELGFTYEEYAEASDIEEPIESDDIELEVTEKGVEVESKAEVKSAVKDKEKEKKHKKEKIKKVVEQLTSQTAEKAKVLYVISDKRTPMLINYMRESGLDVSRVFYSIEQAKNCVIMQDEELRIVVIETGAGVFTNIANRKELIDVIGICSDGSKATIFYSDSAFRAEGKRELKGKEVEWIKYSSTLDTVATVMSKNEQYIEASDYEKDSEEEKGGLAFVGTDTKISCGTLGIEAFTTDKLIKGMALGEEQLEKFKVRI